MSRLSKRFREQNARRLRLLEQQYYGAGLGPQEAAELRQLQQATAHYLACHCQRDLVPLKRQQQRLRRLRALARRRAAT